jgi:hypothetical protein
MKKRLPLYLLLLLNVFAFAQTQEKISYQAVIQSNNIIISNKSLGIQINILQGSVNGASVYQESHIVTSNANGLISLEIGEGTNKSGSFLNVEWSKGPYFIKTSIDFTGGTNYTSIFTSQLLSVPFSFHSKTTDSLLNFNPKAIQSNLPNGFEIKLNGISIDDPYLDIAYLPNFGYLTKYNYKFNLASPSDSSYCTSIPVFVSDTLKNEPVFAHFSYNEIGYITAINIKGIFFKPYYIPHNSTKQTIDGSSLYVYDNQQKKYIPSGLNGQFQLYELFPNDPQVTDFKFSNSIKATIERK